MKKVMNQTRSAIKIRFSALAMLTLISLLSYAQNRLENIGKTETQTPKNLRNSMTLLVAKYNTNPTNAAYYSDKIDVPSMFDDNSFGDNVLRIDNNPATDNSYAIQQNLTSKKIAQKILKTIFFDDRTKTYSYSKMFERGEYTATDVDFLIAKDSKRKEAALKDMGLLLLNNIYVQVYDCESYMDVQVATTEATANGLTSALNDSKLKALNGVAYLYKLNIDQMLQDNSFWDLIDFENNDSKKRENFNNYSFSFKKVSNTNFAIKESQTVSATLSFLSSLAKVDQSTTPLKSEKELMTSMLAKAVTKSTTILCGNLANFEISQSVFAVDPIQIKVGKKESLRKNALYEIKEKVANKNGNLSEQHVAWVRAKYVANNKIKSQGKTEPSKFYKVSGSSISKGMLAKFYPEKGIAISAGYMAGKTLFSGIFLEGTQYLGIPKTKYGLKINFGNMQTVDDENSFISNNQIFFNASNIMFDAFINHSFQISNFSLTPKLGIYYSMSNFKSYDERGITGEPMTDWGKNSDNVSATTMGLSTGLSLNYNIGKSAQITLRYDKGIDFGTTLNDHPGWTYGGRTVTPSFGSRSAIGFGITFLGF